MADNFVGVDEPATIDKRLDTESLLVGGTEVHRERIQIAGDADTEIAEVADSPLDSTGLGLAARFIVDRREIAGLSFSQTLGALASFATSWVDISNTTWLDIHAKIAAVSAVTALIEFTDAADPNVIAPGANDIVRPLTTTLGGSALGGLNEPSFGIPAQMVWARITVTDLTGGQDIDIVVHQADIPPTIAQVPIITSLTDDFRAGIVKSILAARDPSGSYTNIDATTFGDLRVGHFGQEDDNNTQDPPVTLPAFIGVAYAPNVGGAPGAVAADTWEGSWTEIKDFSGASVNAGSTALGRGYAEFSNDAGATISHYYTTLFLGAGDFAVPSNATHYRLLFQNLDTGGTNDFRVKAILHYQARQPFLFPVGGIIDPSFPAMLTKTVQTGQQPDSDFVNVRADGIALQDDTPLGAGGVFLSGWIDTDGWASAELFIATDQISGAQGIEIEFTDDVSSPTLRGTRTYTYDADLVAAGFAVFRFPTELDGLRIRYTNGGTPQGVFFLALTFRVQPTAPQSSLETDLNATNIALMVRGVLNAANDSGIYDNIRRSSGAIPGLRVSVSEHEAEMPLKSLPTIKVTRATVGTSAVEVTSSAPMAGRRSISLKAIASGSTIIYIGHSNAVTSSTGYPLANDQSLDLEVDATTLIWAISSSGSQALSVFEIGT